MACFCVIISNSLSSYEGCRVASFCEKEYDRQSNNIVFCFFFCCHLPGMCHSLSKHFWQIPVFHCGHLRNSVIQWMRKHSINSWPALWNENSPFDFLPPYFFFFSSKSMLLVLHSLGTSIGLFCKSFMEETHYLLSILSSSVLLLETAIRSGAKDLGRRVRIV